MEGLDLTGHYGAQLNEIVEIMAQLSKIGEVRADVVGRIVA